MPLEIFDGKSGRRLIARLPMNQGCFAIVITDEIPHMAVYHPLGVRFNGYPALSPVVSSIPEVVAPMEERRQALLDQYATKNKQLLARKNEVTALSPATPLQALRIGCTQALIDLDLHILGNIMPTLTKQIICTSIMEGRKLALKLPVGMFTDVSTIELGTVLSIEIYNK